MLLIYCLPEKRQIQNSEIHKQNMWIINLKNIWDIEEQKCFRAVIRSNFEISCIMWFLHRCRYFINFTLQTSIGRFFTGWEGNVNWFSVLEGNWTSIYSFSKIFRVIGNWEGPISARYGKWIGWITITGATCVGEKSGHWAVTEEFKKLSREDLGFSEKTDAYTKDPVPKHFELIS